MNDSEYLRLLINNDYCILDDVDIDFPIIYRKEEEEEEEYLTDD